MKAVPTVGECMSAFPHTIGEDIKLSEATHRMHEFGVRHLPVLKGGKLVGILSDRDIKLALSVHPQATDLVVGDVMTDTAYSVLEETPLDQVAETMFRNKYGSTIVVDRAGNTKGVFTAIDALKVLTALLRGNPATVFFNAGHGPSVKTAQGR